MIGNPATIRLSGDFGSFIPRITALRLWPCDQPALDASNLTRAQQGPGMSDHYNTLTTSARPLYQRSLTLTYLSVCRHGRLEAGHHG